MIILHLLCSYAASPSIGTNTAVSSSSGEDSYVSKIRLFGWSAAISRVANTAISPRTLRNGASPTYCCEGKFIIYIANLDLFES